MNRAANKHIEQIGQQGMLPYEPHWANCSCATRQA